MAEKQKKKLVAEFEPGDVIWYEGDQGSEMFLVRTGEVELVKTMGDSEMVLHSLLPKEFCGELALFGDNKRKETARAKVKSEIVFINRRMLEVQFKSVPEWLMAMINTIAQRILNTSKGVKINYEISAEYSLIRTIVHLIEQFSTKEERGVSINLQLVRSESSNLIGFDLQSVDEMLKKLNLVNVLKLQGSRGKIYVAEPERLKQFSEYLIYKSAKQTATMEKLDPNVIQSFDRIYKLMNR